MLKIISAQILTLLSRRRDRRNVAILSQFVVALCFLVFAYAGIFKALMHHEGQEHSFIGGAGAEESLSSSSSLSSTCLLTSGQTDTMQSSTLASSSLPVRMPFAHAVRHDVSPDDEPSSTNVSITPVSSLRFNLTPFDYCTGGGMASSGNKAPCQARPRLGDHTHVCARREECRVLW